MKKASNPPVSPHKLLRSEAIEPVFLEVACSAQVWDGAPQDLIDQLEDIRSDFAALSPNEQVDGADQFENPVADLSSPIGAVSAAGPLLAAAQVLVPVIVVFLIIVTLLIVITSNPLWQRAAREMIRGLKDRSRLLSEKIRDAVQTIVDTIENVLGGTACAELCADEINSVRELQRQINDLLDSMPANDNDPDALEQIKSQLRDLYGQILLAQQAVVDCLVRNGC